jgi:hypothetical protein
MGLFYESMLLNIIDVSLTYSCNTQKNQSLTLWESGINSNSDCKNSKYPAFLAQKQGHVYNDLARINMFGVWTSTTV